ncbi:hypothetical protein E1B28_007795 [Marasmius oreades]|uniref:Uncharacterized protein n=1 Tax=Marasmius oreades TaxID=181124 RepID=A0A9P7UU52_9AGAR|nr:uncharacterized protein E1B28_007795 [Marasmius oreades]KAG7094188.1 hypothetical protein E1B28_007795 [Marasmius oreades]
MNLNDPYLPPSVSSEPTLNILEDSLVTEKAGALLISREELARTKRQDDVSYRRPRCAEDFDADSMRTKRSTLMSMHHSFKAYTPDEKTLLFNVKATFTASKRTITSIECRHARGPKMGMCV